MSDQQTQTTTPPGPAPPPHQEADDGPSPLEQVRQQVRRLRRRYRRQLTPLVALTSTDLLGTAAADAHGGGTLAVLAAGGLAAGAAYGYAHCHTRLPADRVIPWSRVYAAISCTASMAWQTAAATAGSHGLMQTLLWLGGSALALPWWIRHAEPTPDTAVEPPPEPAREPAPQPPAPDWRSVRWGQHMAGKNDPLTGSKLGDITDIRYGWTATVALPRGQHWRRVVNVLDTVASIYDLPDGRVLPEPIPGAPVHRARLTVLTENPLETVTHWPGPGLDPATGVFPLAVTADGQMLSWRLWWPGAGMCHGLVAGTTGSGKSSCLDLILSEVAASDRLIPVIIDGSGGMSLPDWIDAVPYSATTIPNAIDLLGRLVAGMDSRFDVLTRIKWTDKHGRARTGRNSIDPTPEMPGIVVFIDEAHRLLMHSERGREIRRLVELLSQMGRKVAISVVLATQQPSVTQLGGSSVIRDMTKSGNIVALRTAERVSGGQIAGNGLPEPLHMLPAEWPDGSPTHGLGYVTTQRLIRSRTLLVDDPYAQASSITTDRLDQATQAALDQPHRTRAPGGPVHSDMHVTTGTDADARAQVRDALASGVPADPFAIARATGLGWRDAKHVLRTINQ